MDSTLQRLKDAVLAKSRAQHAFSCVCNEHDGALDKLQRMKTRQINAQVGRRNVALEELRFEEQAAREEIHHLKLSMQNPDATLKTGMLEKQSKLLKQWAVRRVVLTSSGIFSFRTGKDAPATDHLSDASVQLIFDSKGSSVSTMSERVFEVTSGGKSLVFQTSSATEMSEWMQAISQAIGGMVIGHGLGAVENLAMHVSSLIRAAVVLGEFELGGRRGQHTFRELILPTLERLETEGVVVKAVVQT